MSKWDKFYIGLAAYIATASKDPSTQTGAVIVRPDRTIAALGFNGFPRGCNDDKVLYADRDLKYARIIHCEMNAILTAREPLHGYTLYTWPFMSCNRCAAHVIQSGIKRCVAPLATEEALTRWKDSFLLSEALFEEAGVTVDFVTL